MALAYLLLHVASKFPKEDRVYILYFIIPILALSIISFVTFYSLTKQFHVDYQDFLCRNRKKMCAANKTRKVKEE